MDMIQKIIRNKTILAALSIVAGIYLILARRSALDMIVRMLGYGLIAAAIGYVLSYFLGTHRDETQLGYAVLAGVGGILVITLARSIVNIFPMLMGLLLLLNGLGNLVQSFSNGGTSIADKVLPGLVALGGLLIMIHPGAIVNSVVILAGVALIVNGLADLNMIRRFW